MRPCKLRVWIARARLGLRKKLFFAAAVRPFPPTNGIRAKQNRWGLLLRQAASGGGAIRHALHMLGLDQTRCCHCLRPFSPAENLRPLVSVLATEGPAGLRAPLCPECCALFASYTGPRCPRCGLPSARSPADVGLARPLARAAHIPCGHCLSQPPPWDGLAYYGLYQGALRDALLRLKFGGELPLAALLGACLLEAARCLPRPDVLTAMPQHPAHLRRRGFNQAHELARAVRSLTDLPLRSDLLLRPVQSAPQAGLSATERRRNVRRSFHAPHTAKGLRIWLIDDVMTTGSTLAAAALALREGGAKEVHVLFAARTPHRF